MSNYYASVTPPTDIDLPRLFGAQCCRCRNNATLIFAHRRVCAMPSTRQSSENRKPTTHIANDSRTSPLHITAMPHTTYYLHLFSTQAIFEPEKRLPACMRLLSSLPSWHQPLVRLRNIRSCNNRVLTDIRQHQQHR